MGQGGSDMGAPVGTCSSLGASGRLVHLAAGRYGMVGTTLTQNVSVQGTGQDETFLEGTVFGLRTSATLSEVTVTSGASGGIRVYGGQDPEVRDCRIARNSTFARSVGAVRPSTFASSCGDQAFATTRKPTAPP